MPPDPHRSSVCDHVVLRRHLRRRRVEPRRVEAVTSSPRRATTSTRRCASPTRRRARCATSCRRAARRSSRRATTCRTGGRCPRRTSSSGSPSATTGATCTCTTSRTGRLKNPITTGDWIVLQVLKVDEKTRTIYFTGAGREPGDPYYRRFYSIKFDGSGLTLLTPENADHDVTMSPVRRLFLDRYSTPQDPPVTVLRDLTGKTIMPVEKADISRLVAAGWKPPMSFTVKARDGKTDLYGLLFRPDALRPDRSGTRSSTASTRARRPAASAAAASRPRAATARRSPSSASSWSRSTPWARRCAPSRSTPPTTATWATTALPDQVAGMKQLADELPLDRHRPRRHLRPLGRRLRHRRRDVPLPRLLQGGHLGGRQPRQPRVRGRLGREVAGAARDATPDGTTSYDNQANQLVAKNLKGKLLLAHGTTDNNVPPYNTLLVVNALIAANKDFDLIMLPNRTHGFGNERVHGAAPLGLLREVPAGRDAAARVPAAPDREPSPPLTVRSRARPCADANTGTILAGSDPADRPGFPDRPRRSGPAHRLLTSRHHEGSALRAPPPGQAPGVHGHGRALARPGHRRHDHGVQLDAERAARSAARRRRRGPRRRRRVGHAERDLHRLVVARLP